MLSFSELRKDFKKNKYKYLLVLPVLIYLFLFCYKPMYGIIIAFQRYRPTLGFDRSPWVGFDNFVRFFKDVNFWRVVRNTFSISFLKFNTVIYVRKGIENNSKAQDFEVKNIAFYTILYMRMLQMKV